MKIRCHRCLLNLALLLANGWVYAEGFSLSSPAFAPGTGIPREFTCDGADRSPPLAWSGVPAAARSLVLTVTDPDAPDPAAPQRTWVHWVLYNLPSTSRGLATNVATYPVGTQIAHNDWSRADYGGPCPPRGRHRYFFNLYALDIPLDIDSAATAASIRAQFTGHVLARTELIGTYARDP